MSSTTPLHDASHRGDVARLKEIISLMGECPDVNEKNEKGETPLYISAFHKHFECVKVLIEAGAIVNCKNINGYTPLHAAAYNGCTECALHLIQNGAVVNVKNKNGWTPLHRSCYRRNLEVSALLLDSKSAVNAKNDQGYTPLYLAAYHNHKEGCLLLLENNADIQLTNKNGKSAIDIARSKGHNELADFLLRESKIQDLEKSVAALENNLAKVTTERDDALGSLGSTKLTLQKSKLDLAQKSDQLEQIYGKNIENLSLTELEELESTFESSLHKIREAKKKFVRCIVARDGDERVVLVPQGKYMLIQQS